MKISSLDLIEANEAMTILFGIVDELNLNSGQFARKMEAIKGRVAMQYMIRSLRQDVEVIQPKAENVA